MKNGTRFGSKAEAIKAAQLARADGKTAKVYRHTQVITTCATPVSQPGARIVRYYTVEVQ